MKKYKENDLSQVHPQTDKPVHNGVYKIYTSFGKRYSYWDGMCWSWFDKEVDGVAECVQFKHSVMFPWQGLRFNLKRRKA